MLCESSGSPVHAALVHTRTKLLQSCAIHVYLCVVNKGWKLLVHNLFVLLIFPTLMLILTSKFCSQEYKFTPFDGNVTFKAYVSAPALPSKPLSPHDYAEGKKSSSKEAWKEKKEQRSICYVMCAEEGDSFPDHHPPCTGDNETKSASILGRMAGPIAFLSCDRYTPHVSQLWTHHLAGAEKMR